MSNDIKIKVFNNENLVFIDIVNPMIGENGRPIPSLYISDSLHMSDLGYDIWEDKLRSFIEN